MFINYTDGSKNEYESGAAVFDPQAEITLKFSIDEYISIMHIEMLAILEALSLILSYSKKKFVILSDSKSGLLHLARLTSDIRGSDSLYYFEVYL